MGKRKVRRGYKDSLFRMVFREKKELLSLYNAINGTNYDDPDELVVPTIEDVLYMGRKNDVSFLIEDVMNLYEHQSSWNPNMRCGDCCILPCFIKGSLSRTIWIFIPALC